MIEKDQLSVPLRDRNRQIDRNVRDKNGCWRGRGCDLGPFICREIWGTCKITISPLFELVKERGARRSFLSFRYRGLAHEILDILHQPYCGPRCLILCPVEFASTSFSSNLDQKIFKYIF